MNAAETAAGAVLRTSCIQQGWVPHQKSTPCKTPALYYRVGIKDCTPTTSTNAPLARSSKPRGLEISGLHYEKALLREAIILHSHLRGTVVATFSPSIEVFVLSLRLSAIISAQLRSGLEQRVATALGRDFCLSKGAGVAVRDVSRLVHTKHCPSSCLCGAHVFFLGGDWGFQLVFLYFFCFFFSATRREFPD